MNNDEVQKDQVEEVKEETKEENEMGFFKKHRKGLIFGGLGALAAGAVGLFLATKKDSDDDLEDDDFDEFEELDDDEAGSDEVSEEA